jgi:hypothetical protein
MEYLIGASFKAWRGASKCVIHMFVALLIAQRVLLKPHQVLTLGLSIAQTMNIIAL